GDETERFAHGLVELTAPLWGAGELQSIGDVHALESRILGAFPELKAGLECAGLRQERRVIRLRPLRPVFRGLDGGDLELAFDLPKGTYATTLLRELAHLDEDRAYDADPLNADGGE
ncbi:MAG TPA: tRNA pseudouridine(13) synthase TruD, partial [Verrucomicrobiales bacterium]|nr:tRNA pseudouridine(13) synthase TruD [Verrucomicrobiales bacterium]